MVEQKHTPGPWTVDDGDSDVVGIFDADGAAVAYCSDDVRRGVGLNTNDRANANLIASAPELLDALRAVLKSEHTGGTIGAADYRIKNSVLDAARAAVAKAEGRQ